MRFGSVCSGIEAASVAWEPLGWKAAWFSEIEKFPSSVLAHHYPDTPNLGDMTALPDRILSGEIEAPEIFCGGTPCQAFSVAGLRQSLNDDRGNLSLTFVGIANAIDHVRSVRGDSSSIIFWENVPGVLNTKDNAFGCFIGALAGEVDPVTCPNGKWSTAGVVVGQKRAVAWRVLDAQYFGVAQRRRRVFVVASARADFDPAAVLFEFEGLRRDSAPSRKAGERVAPCVTNGPPFSRTGNERVEAEAMVVQAYEVANCLTARMHKGINTTVDEGQTPVIALQDVTATSAVAIGTDCYNGSLTGDIAATMGTPGSSVGASGPTVMVQQPVALGVDLQNSCFSGNISVTLQSVNTSNRMASVQFAMQVRRLTPVECERLQGFPDNYTNIKDKCPDGPRYKALGNSWAVPVVRWIGKRIQGAIDAP
jgi:DNA (cytosine-5)-methyltransferase 1